MNVLVLNSGSSTLKFQLIATDLEHIEKNSDKRLCRGLVEGIGDETTITVTTRNQAKRVLKERIANLTGAVEFLVRWLASAESGISEVRSATDFHAVGHRVVHGGEKFSESVVVNEQVLRDIEASTELAPLHTPGNVRCIKAVREVLGEKVPQVAVFDTAFHQHLPEVAFLYALPYRLYEQHHIRRYGFHGTSHRFVAYRYRVLTKKTREGTNIITLHLGNGCSAAAIRRGYPVDTSMGMTPLEGLVMGTRSGDVDAAVVNLIAMKEGLSTAEVESLLNTQSGLLGISGLTNDMRVLQQEAKEHGDPRVRLAIEIFCYRARKYLGAYLAAMSGADAVVFTGGIGENSADIRQRICEGLEWFGLRLDNAKNDQASGHEERITSDDSKVHAFVIPTDEELLIARDTVRCVLGEPHPS